MDAVLAWPLGRFRWLLARCREEGNC